MNRNPERRDTSAVSGVVTPVHCAHRSDGVDSEMRTLYTCRAVGSAPGSQTLKRRACWDASNPSLVPKPSRASTQDALLHASLSNLGPFPCAS